MYGLINIGGKEIAMEANAFSPYVYRQLFHEDFLVEAQKEPPAPDLFQKMGFVMAKQAEHLGTPELMKLSVEQFYEWLMQFDALDIASRLTATKFGAIFVIDREIEVAVCMFERELCRFACGIGNFEPVFVAGADVAFFGLFGRNRRCLKDIVVRLCGVILACRANLKRLGC